MRHSRWRFTAAAAAVVLGVLFVFAMLSRGVDDYAGCDRPNGQVYDVVFDAGSTGSRVHIFGFVRDGNSLVLRTEHARRVTPGLSSYAGNPSGAAESLADLLRFAVEVVPPAFARCTSVTLKATAGLRLLPTYESEAILKKVEELLTRRSPFSNRGVSVISGNEEGVYGWVTVNYLLGHLFTQAAPSVATVDMGGASSQIVFEVGRDEGEWLPFNYVTPLQLNGRKLFLYHHSYLGFGLNEARSRLYSEVLAEATNRHEPVPFACFPKGFSSDVSGKKEGVSGRLEAGSQDYTACRGSLVRLLFDSPQSTAAITGQQNPQQQVRGDAKACEFRACGIEGIPQPVVSFKGRHVYVFSYFYDRLQPFLATDNKPISVGSVQQFAQRVCNDPSSPHNTETMCLDLVYLYTYLHDGLRLPDGASLMVREKIKEKSLSWSLGAAILHLTSSEV